jgi:hypothetical protein
LPKKPPSVTMVRSRRQKPTMRLKPDGSPAVNPASPCGVDVGADPSVRHSKQSLTPSPTGAPQREHLSAAEVWADPDPNAFGDGREGVGDPDSVRGKGPLGG